MVPSQIEKEVLVEAPIDVVWRAITEPGQITQWFSAEAEVDGHAGGQGRLAFPSGEEYYLHVEAFEPPHRFAYRWLHENGVRHTPANSMLVEFTLSVAGAATRVRVVESGFDEVDWSNDAKATYFERHSQGWHTIIGRLADYASRG